MNRRPHPNAAKVFANWMISKDGQLAWQNNSEHNSMRMDIPKDMISDQCPVANPGGGIWLPAYPNTGMGAGLRSSSLKGEPT